MNNTVKIIIVCMVVFAIGFIAGGVGKTPKDLAATVYNRAISFDEGILVDQTEVISGTGAASFTTGAFSSTLGVTGVSTLADELKVNRTASSTIQVGSTASGVGTGCLILGDSGGATSTPVYITASGGTVSATTTKPDICQ